MILSEHQFYFLYPLRKEVSAHADCAKDDPDGKADNLNRRGKVRRGLHLQRSGPERERPVDGELRSSRIMPRICGGWPLCIAIEDPVYK